MELVTELGQIKTNIEFLEAVRADMLSENASNYLSLIKRGICFVPYQAHDGIAFAPSRFIGYVENSFEKHASNDKKHGGKTNPAITKIMGLKPIVDRSLESEYLRFCARIELSPSKTGTRGNPRKYWITDELMTCISI